jgi:cysteine desulfurase
MNVYLDNAATTQMLPEVIDAMKSYMIEYYGNPSGLYTIGFKTKNMLNDCRKTIAQTINV